MVWELLPYGTHDDFFCRSSNLKSLDSTLTSKSEALQECNNQRIRAEEKTKSLEQEKESREALVHRLKDEVVRLKNLNSN